MLTLGGFQFSIATAAYQELARITEYRWPALARFMQGDALQYVGPGPDFITLPGVIYPEWRGGDGQLSELRALAAQGLPLVLIDGAGAVLGRWVVERVEERQSVFAAEGKPRRQEFALGLRKFDDVGPDPLDSLVESLASVGVPALPGPESLATSITGTMSTVTAGLNQSLIQVQAVAADIGTAIGDIAAPIARCVDVATGLKNAAQDAKGMLKSTVTALRDAKSLTALVNAGASAAANAGQAGASLGVQAKALTSLGTVPAQAMAAVNGAMVQANRLTTAAASLQAQALDALAAL